MGARPNVAAVLLLSVFLGLMELTALYGLQS